MKSKTVFSDAEITRPPRPFHDTAWLTKRGNPAVRIPAPLSRTDASHWAGRVASLGHRAAGRLTRWIASYSLVLLRLSLGGIFFWYLLHTILIQSLRNLHAVLKLPRLQQVINLLHVLLPALLVYRRCV